MLTTWRVVGCWLYLSEEPPPRASPDQAGSSVALGFRYVPFLSPANVADTPDLTPPCSAS